MPLRDEHRNALRLALEAPLPADGLVTFRVLARDAEYRATVPANND